MKGKFYGVGVGPGAPDLVTMAAIKQLQSGAVVAVPTAAAGKESLAHTICKSYLPQNTTILELVFPMITNKGELQKSWDLCVEQIVEQLQAGQDVCFVTLGDPTVYSTCMYVYDHILQQGYECALIPGVTSFCAAAAQAGVSLAEGGGSLAVLSAYHEAEFEELLHHFDTTVLMKAARHMPQIVEKLEGRDDVTAYTITDCGMETQQVFVGIDQLPEEKLSYFTTMLLKKNRG